MMLSVIIPTCHRPAALSACLQRLQPGAQSLPASQYQVIVTDDSHNHETEILVSQQFTWVHYTRGPQRGPAANRNHGARQAKGEWLVFTDDDCLPDPGWLQAYADAITQHPECRAFEGAILPDHWDLLKKDMAECPVNDKGGCFWSANIMVQKRLCWQVGGFDEQFKIPAQEDQDLQNRLAVHGPIVFIRQSIVTHPVRIASFNRSVAKIPASIKNWHSYYSKFHGPVATLLKGYKTQILALRANLAKGKLKAALLNLITFFCLLPVVFSHRFIK